MTKQWTMKNVSTAFISIKLLDDRGEIARIDALPPGTVKPVRTLFRKKDGSADIEACRANQDVRQHLEGKRLVLDEQELPERFGNTGRLFNEDDPEPERVRKILEARRTLKESIAKTGETSRAPKALPAEPAAPKKPTRHEE
jgi:hypothetical protein